MSIFNKKIKVKASDFSQVLSSLVIARSSELAENKKFIDELNFDNISYNRLYFELTILFGFLVSDVFLRSKYDESIKKTILDNMHQKVCNYIYTALNLSEQKRVSLQDVYQAKYKEYHSTFSGNK